MTTSGLDLLQKLGSGIRPDGIRPATKPGQPLEGLDFASLLRQADSGAVSSGRKVQVSKDAGVSLTDGQLDRLGRVADAAEASGATKLLALIDGKAVVMNVATRTVEGTLDPSKALNAGGVLTGINSAVIVPPEAGSPLGPIDPIPAGVALPSARTPLAPTNQVVNQSLAQLLSGLGKTAPSAIL